MWLKLLNNKGRQRENKRLFHSNQGLVMNITYTHLIQWMDHNFKACMTNLKEMWWDMQLVKCLEWRGRSRAGYFVRFCRCSARELQRLWKAERLLCIRYILFSWTSVMNIQSWLIENRNTIVGFRPVNSSHKEKKEIQDKKGTEKSLKNMATESNVFELKI